VRAKGGEEDGGETTGFMTNSLKERTKEGDTGKKVKKGRVKKKNCPTSAYSISQKRRKDILV